jgi:GTPase SAR1 family protein
MSPLTNPPNEIVKQGNAAILNYFDEQEAQGTDRLYEAKMLLIGEGGAGKTSLLRRLYQSGSPLPDENETTKGIDIYRHEFKLDNGRNFHLNVWDFGGQEIYHATHQFFLTKRSLYVLLDDTRKDDKTLHDASFKYWLPEFFEQKRLSQRKKDSKLKVECPASYEDVDVLELLDGINVKELPGWGKLQKLFISYSKDDIRHKDNLLKHLTGLRDQIVTWNDRDILPGEEWDDRIKEELFRAKVVLYLVSANSMATHYIQNVELPLVEQRCRNKECVLIPVIVDFCLWEDLDFAKYNALPDKGQPVTDRSWVNENEAWLKVVQGIKKIIESSKL